MQATLFPQAKPGLHTQGLLPSGMDRCCLFWQRLPRGTFVFPFRNPSMKRPAAFSVPEASPCRAEGPPWPSFTGPGSAAINASREVVPTTSLIYFAACKHIHTTCCRQLCGNAQRQAANKSLAARVTSLPANLTHCCHSLFPSRCTQLPLPAGTASSAPSCSWGCVTRLSSHMGGSRAATNKGTNAAALFFFCNNCFLTLPTGNATKASSPSYFSCSACTQSRNEQPLSLALKSFPTCYKASNKSYHRQEVDFHQKRK